MKKINFSFLTILVILLFSCSLPNPISKDSPNRYVGYVPVSEMHLEGFNEVLDKATHLNLSFFNADQQGQITYNNRTTESDQKLKTFISQRQDKGTKVLFSIGGGLYDANMYLIEHYNKVLRPENRQSFINEIVDFIEEFNFDGIDIDLEHRCINKYYSSFIIELKNSLNPNANLLTCAIAKYQGHLVSAKAYKAFDFINIMVYDYTGLGSDKPGDLGSYKHVEKELIYWTGIKKIPAEKIVIGVPYYGYSWQMDDSGNLLKKGAKKYSWFVVNFPDKIKTMDNFTIENPNNTITHYATNSFETISKKTKLSQHYGGIMCWHILNDVANPQTSLSFMIDGILNN